MIFFFFVVVVIFWFPPSIFNSLTPLVSQEILSCKITASLDRNNKKKGRFIEKTSRGVIEKYLHWKDNNESKRGGNGFPSRQWSPKRIFWWCFWIDSAWIIDSRIGMEFKQDTRVLQWRVYWESKKNSKKKLQLISSDCRQLAPPVFLVLPLHECRWFSSLSLSLFILVFFSAFLSLTPAAKREKIKPKRAIENQFERVATGLVRLLYVYSF